MTASVTALPLTPAARFDARSTALAASLRLHFAGDVTADERRTLHRACTDGDPADRADMLVLAVRLADLLDPEEQAAMLTVALSHSDPTRVCGLIADCLAEADRAQRYADGGDPDPEWPALPWREHAVAMRDEAYQLAADAVTKDGA